MRALALTLAALLLSPTGQAQERAGLKIVVLEGEGAFNDIKRKRARNPVVEVRDEANHPVAGAEVVFTLPETGAGGTFAASQTNRH